MELFSFLLRKMKFLIGKNICPKCNSKNIEKLKIPYEHESSHFVSFSLPINKIHVLPNYLNKCKDCKHEWFSLS